MIIAAMFSMLNVNEFMLRKTSFTFIVVRWKILQNSPLGSQEREEKNNSESYGYSDFAWAVAWLIIQVRQSQAVSLSPALSRERA